MLTSNLIITLTHSQVEEMGKAVDVAERNTARFGLTQAEVASRRRWIMQTQREVRRLLHQAQGHTRSVHSMQAIFLLVQRWAPQS